MHERNGHGRGTPMDNDDDRAVLERRIAKLDKINAALMGRVERAMDVQGNAYALFQTAISLDNEIRARTVEVKSALERLARANDALVAARDAAERANRFKTGFFTAVGHDLLQPLHAARLSLSALEAGGAPRENSAIVGQIDHALSSIEELLRSILDISKLDSGTVQPLLQDFRLDTVIDGLVCDLRPLAAAKGLSLTARPTRATVASDPLLLRRILQNLLANAVRYTDRGGVRIAARRRGDTMRIEVWDSGPGIPDAERGRIFEEFERGAASMRSRSAGFGLGLAIVQRSAAILGHTVDLCTRVGKGTMFSVSVPLVDMAAAPSCDRPPADPVLPYGFAGRGIVVIDNDGNVIEAMRVLLERWGFHVHFARSLGEVERLAAENALAPDLVLADYHLDDGANGLQAVARLRARYGAALPVVVITADQSPELVHDIAAAGCEMLMKPVKPAELRALLRHLIA